MTDTEFRCDKCERSFSNRRGLSAHLRYHDPEQRKKTSQAMLGHKVSDETRAKMSKSHLDKEDSDETRKRRSEAQKMVWSRPGYREEFSRRNRGVRTQTEESNQKRSESMRRYWENQANHDRHASRLGHPISDTTKLKISRSLLKTNQDEGTIRRRSEAMRRRWQDPDQREHLMNSRRS